MLQPESLPCSVPCHLQFRTEENFQFQAAEMISSNIETVFADRDRAARIASAATEETEGILSPEKTFL